MSQKYFITVLIPFLLLLEVSFAKVPVDCRVVTGGVTECNPFGLKFVKAKEIEYDKDSKKLIVDKIMPVPPKTSVKVISVADMIEKYIKVEDSMRFKGTKEDPLSSYDTHMQKSTQKKKKLETKKKNVQTRIEELRIQRKVLLEEMQKIKEDKRRKREERIKLAKEIKAKKLKQIIEKQEKIKFEKKFKNKGFYTIEKGDRLSLIAKKFNITLDTLTILNHLKKTSAIRVGKKLIIPYKQKRIDAIIKGEYIVEVGDSLGSIAKDFNLTIKIIKKYNILKKNKIICIGQKLTLPLPHKLPELKAKQKIIAAKQALQRKKAEKARKIRLAKKNKKVKMIRGFGKRKLRVTATAYSSHRRQTDKTPFIAAWNNRLRPGMKIIAVSRDLLTRYGLRNGTRVKIGGLSGYYTVRDKMNKRFRRRIDIYMGVNRRRALRWGRRSVVLSW